MNEYAKKRLNELIWGEYCEMLDAAAQFPGAYDYLKDASKRYRDDQYELCGLDTQGEGDETE